MKTQLVRSLLLGLTALGTLALASCQATSAAPTSAISCAKCGTVYFKSPSTTAAAAGKGYVTLKSSSKMSCPDCDNKVVAWVKTGTFTEHTCKTCGGAMKHCASH